MKRFFALLFAVLIAVPVITPAVSAAEAENLTASCRITSPQAGGNIVQLLDGNLATKITASTEAIITVQSAEPVTHLYLIWERPPNSWDLIVRDNSGNAVRTAYGEHGFIEEYLRFDSPLTEFSIQFHGKNNLLCEVYIFSDGDLPDWVHQWQPPCEDADMLLFPARGGDEMLYFGGTLPYYTVERGMQVQVAYMTNQWNEKGRVYEILDGLYTVGVRAYPVMSTFAEKACPTIKDARAAYDEDAFVAYEVEQIRRFKPEVVIGHDLSGEGGEGVRRLSADTLSKAVKAAGNARSYRDSAEKYGVFEVPKTYLHLYLKNRIVMNWDAPISNFSDETLLDVAKRGYTANTSLPQDFSGSEADEPYDCRKFGLFKTTVGPDKENNDFFENIAFGTPSAEDIEASTAPAASSSSLVETSSPLPGVSGGAAPAASAGNVLPENFLFILTVGVAACICFIAAFALRRKKD